jgi:peptide/nickel transport system permease protein
VLTPEVLTELPTEAGDSPDVAAVVAAPRSRVVGLLQAFGSLVAGVVVLYVILVVMGHAKALLKVPVALVGIALLYLACDRGGKSIWGRYFDTGFWLSSIWIGGIILATTFADLLPLGNYQDTTKTIAIAGNARPDLFSSHPLGTNNFALDLLSRSIYAARVSLLTATLAVTISIIVGGTIGMLAGYYRGWIDPVVGTLTDSLLAFPALILLVALAAVLGSPTTVTSAVLKEGVALAVVGIPTMVRLSRANTLTFAQREFVTASRALGARNRRIIFRELMPNVFLPILSYAFIIVAVLIVAEGSLAFLGLGLQQPKPTWGNMIAEGGLTQLRQYPHIPLVPGVFMFLTVFGFNRVGEKARHHWDPRVVKI